MTEKLELYKCNVCGNIVEVVISGEGELVCCGEPMKRLNAGTNDEAATEKHVPIFDHNDDKSCIIRVGAEPHPMIQAHYIMFIEAISDDKDCIIRKYLHPDDEPKMQLKNFEEKFLAREFCNIHGLWEAQSD